MTPTSELKKYISIYSGILYEIPETDTHLLDKGQIPLTDFPKSGCKHCAGKGYIGKDKRTGVYMLCKCTAKLSAIDLKDFFIENVRLHTTK